MIHCHNDQKNASKYAYKIVITIILNNDSMIYHPNSRRFTLNNTRRKRSTRRRNPEILYEQNEKVKGLLKSKEKKTHSTI
eukprot:snap_masked-scaffold_6-processed-gene-16.46-mRNA-1 protein AED:1.00 eAED:1.00 QI:0/-1/0/0/-1/1/1/0/79